MKASNLKKSLRGIKHAYWFIEDGTEVLVTTFFAVIAKNRFDSGLRKVLINFFGDTPDESFCVSMIDGVTTRSTEKSNRTTLKTYEEVFGSKERKILLDTGLVYKEAALDIRVLFCEDAKEYMFLNNVFFDLIQGLDADYYKGNHLISSSYTDLSIIIAPCVSSAECGAFLKQF